MGPKENTNSTFTFCSFQKLKNNSSDFKSAINKIIYVQSKLCELKLEKFQGALYHLLKTTQVGILHISRRLKHVTWWKSSLLQSISKSGEQTKKSRKITLPQVIACTLYFLKFLKQSGVSHVIFQPELPVFPRKWLVFWCCSCFNITKTNFLNMPRIDWAINIFLINSIWNH